MLMKCAVSAFQHYFLDTTKWWGRTESEQQQKRVLNDMWSNVK